MSLDFSVEFSEAVLVVGTPRLTLTVGANTRYATYVSGSGTDTLEFSYAVVTADEDADGIACAASIDLNSGTIKDAAGNSAVLTLTVPALTGVLVDGDA